MKTSIIILTYNNLLYTKLCLESIRKYTTPKSYEVIIVDNNSSDGSQTWIRTQKNVHSIFNRENRGFPKGCNQGMTISTGDNILLLNNDVVVTSNWLDNLLIALHSESKVGAVGPVANVCSNNQNITVSYKTLDQMQKFASNYNKSYPDKWTQKKRLIGFCMLFKREVLNKVGFLDELFSPGNFEDDDYSLRIRLAGYKLFLCKDTFVHHFGSISFAHNMEELIKLRNINKKKFEDKWGAAYEDVFKA